MIDHCYLNEALWIKKLVQSKRGEWHFRLSCLYFHSKTQQNTIKASTLVIKGTEKIWKFYCSATRITLCAFVRTMPWVMYILTARSSPNHRHHRHRSLISKILELVVADIVAEWQKNSKEAHWDVNVSPETIAVDSVKNTSTQTIRSDKNYQYSPSYNNPCNNHD